MDFEEYVAARGQALLRFAYVLTGDSHQAQDLVQTALMDAYRHWRRVARAEHPDAYVRRMVVNAHLTWRRRRSIGERAAADVGATRSAPDHADAVVERDAVWQALNRLPPRGRAVLALRYYADYDDAAIADLLGIAVGSVRSVASRSLATLREDINPAAQGNREMA